MAIAVQGKGGIGKSTFAAGFAMWLAQQGIKVAAVDADVNQQLGIKLGFTEEQLAEIPSLSENWKEIQNHLRGDNPRIVNRADLLKTTPPGPGSRLFWIDDDHPVIEGVFRRPPQYGESAERRVLLTRGGDLTPDDVGSCYHSKTHALEALLTHYVATPGSELIIDMLAGNDNTASSIPFKCDTNIVVCSAGKDSLKVVEQSMEYLLNTDPCERMNIVVVANNVPRDRLATLGERIAVYEARLKGTDYEQPLIARDSDGLPLALAPNDRVRYASEDGEPLSLDMFTEADLAVFAAVHAMAQQNRHAPKHRAAVARHFHEKNAQHWGKDSQRFLDQIDEKFVTEATQITGDARQHHMTPLQVADRRAVSGPRLGTHLHPHSHVAATATRGRPAEQRGGSTVPL